MMMQDEWEAWVENPVTRHVKELIEARKEEFQQARAELHPMGFDSAHQYHTKSVFLATAVDTYTAILESFETEAYAELFEETE